MRYQHFRIVQQLVEAGHGSHYERYQSTALMWTVANGHVEIALYLIDHCDVACVDSEG
jgi:hypothetical protein